MSTTLSVIIPCHNAEPYLAETVQSLLDQRRTPDEILIVDDRSTDRSLDIARGLARRHSGVTVLKADYGRASSSRNFGALHARGELLMFLDADDVLRDDTLRALAGALADAPHGVAICPWFRLECDSGRWRTAPPSCRARRDGEDYLSAWLTGWYHPPCAVLWSRHAFDMAGGWDECATVNDDGDLMMRSLLSGAPLVETKEGAGYYRRLPTGQVSLSGSRRTSDGLASRLRIVDKIAFRLQVQGELDRYGGAVAEALDLIASEARADHGLAAQARALARRYRRRGESPAHISVMRSAAAAPRVAHVDSGELRTRFRAAGTSRSQRWAPPLVSVIIPTYNRAHVLTPAISCVLNQTCADIELLVVDDGSTDDTAAVVTSFSDARVRYLRQETNRGASAARNVGLRRARAQFIAFLDSDDDWSPDKLARQLEVFAANGSDTGLVYTGVERVEADGRRTTQRPEAHGDIYRELLWHNAIHGGGSNVMLRRNVVASAGFFNERLQAIEDYEYWLRIARFFAVAFVDAPLMRYHDSPASGRRSRALEVNLAARWWFYETYAEEMRRAGVAHMFLLHTARWAVRYGGADLPMVRPFVTRAVREKPTSRMAVATLLEAVVPGASHLAWVNRHAVINDPWASGF
jgi:O-antigen biosynthesis protein